MKNQAAESFGVSFGGLLASAVEKDLSEFEKKLGIDNSSYWTVDQRISILLCHLNAPDMVLLLSADKRWCYLCQRIEQLPDNSDKPDEPVTSQILVPSNPVRKKNKLNTTDKWLLSLFENKPNGEYLTLDEINTAHKIDNVVSLRNGNQCIEIDTARRWFTSLNSKGYNNKKHPTKDAWQRY